MKKFLLYSLSIALLAIFLGNSIPTAQAAEPYGDPAIATTCGQSPGALMVKMIAQKAGVACDQNDNITAEDLAKSNYKTLFITMGSSGKGLGAAGINIEDDIKRITDLIAQARSMNMTIIGTQFEGMKRRTDQSDEKTIDAVAPFVDVIMVKSDGDADGRFSKIAQEKNIPIHVVEQPLDITPTVKQLFGK